MLSETDPDLMAEARAFLELLRPMIERTAAGNGETLRFTLTVPAEDALLAAWLVLKDNMRRHRQQGPLYRPVCLKRDSDGYRLADWHRAKSYLHAAITDRLGHERAYLESGTHPLLRPVPVAATYSSPVDPILDDDIPF